MKRQFLLTGTFFIICSIYIFTLFSWISLQTLSHLLQRWGHQTEMTIYLRPEVSVAQISKLTEILNKFSNEISSNFQSQDDIRKSINKLMPKGDVDFTNNDELVAIIPPHFIITGSSNLFGSTLLNLFDSINTEIKKLTFVESTSYGKSWMDKYTLVLNSFRSGTMVFLTALAMIIILAIGNAIRSHINSKKDEIAILELVGATSSMIRKPFLIEGALLSVSSMIFAFIIISTSTYFIKNNKFELLQFLDLGNNLHQFSLLEWIVGITLSAIVGIFGSYFCLSEINTGWAASNHDRHA